MTGTLSGLESVFTAKGTAMESTCRALYDPKTAGKAWDIHPLYNLASAEGANRNLLRGYKTLGTGHWAHTVVYNGQCVLAGALNYILFGRASKLCSDAAKKFGWKPYSIQVKWPLSFKVPGVNPVQNVSITWSKENAVTATIYQKIVGHKPPQNPGTAEFDESVDFTRAGYTDARPGKRRTLLANARSTRRTPPRRVQLPVGEIDWAAKVINRRSAAGRIQPAIRSVVPSENK